jgi:hypothetical protein
MSSTTPSLSTARHSQRFSPPIFTTISSMIQQPAGRGCRQPRLLAKRGPNLIVHLRTVSPLTSTPHSAKELLKVPDAGRKPEIQPKRMPDDLRREACRANEIGYTVRLRLQGQTAPSAETCSS